MSDEGGEPTSGLAKVRAGQGQGQSPQLLYLPYAGRCSEFLSEKGLPWLCPCSQSMVSMALSLTAGSSLVLGLRHQALGC